MDDICDTGQTLSDIVGNRTDIITVTLFQRYDSTFQPTIVGEIIQDEWIEFPWEHIMEE